MKNIITEFRVISKEKDGNLNNALKKLADVSGLAGLSHSRFCEYERGARTAPSEAFNYMLSVVIDENFSHLHINDRRNLYSSLRLPIKEKKQNQIIKCSFVKKKS